MDRDNINEYRASRGKLTHPTPTPVSRLVEPRNFVHNNFRGVGQTANGPMRNHTRCCALCIARAVYKLFHG